MRQRIMRSVLLLAALAPVFGWAPSMRSAVTHPRTSIQPLRHTMSLTTPTDARMVSSLLEETGSGSSVVVLYFCQSPSFSLSHAVVERAAAAYTTSQLYGGAPLVVLQIDTDANADMASVCEERSISVFPTIQVWNGGVCAEVVAAELEAKLLALGVAGKGTARPDNVVGTATFETDLGTGKPSATAVDEIDFTGGRALGTTKDGKRGIPNSGARSTRDFFPGLGLDEKVGDDMAPGDGTPGSAPKKPRRDNPFGFGGGGGPGQ